MGTGSVVIKKITAILAWLNAYFETSLIFRGFSAVKNAARDSRILGVFTATEHRDYWQGSFVLRAIAFVAGGVIALAGKIVRGIARANETSLNRRAYRAIANSAFAGFWKKSLSECVPARLFRWFFGTCDSALKVTYMAFLMGALVIPSHLWNNIWLLVSAAVFTAIFGVKWLLSDAKPDFSKISPALVIFVFFCALSIHTGYGGADSLRVFVIFFACVVHSVLVSLVFRDKNDLRMFFMFMAAALVLTALFGFYQFIAGIEIREELVDLTVSPGLSRLYSTMGNPNNDAKMWGMLLPFVLAAIVAVRCDTKRLLLAGAVFLVVAAFALTYSRSGYLALAAGVGVFILMAAPRLVPIALVLLVFALPFVPASVMNRLLTLGQDTSSQYRFLIWGGVLRMLEDFWVQGIGMGPAAFIRIYRGYADIDAMRSMHAHNMFLDIIVHSGIGALAAFLAYLFRLFKRGIAAHLNSGDKEYKIFISAGIGALAVFVVFGVGEYVWFHPRVMLVFWVVAGICENLGVPPRTPQTF